MASLKDVGERSVIWNILKRIREPPGIGPGDDAAVIDTAGKMAVCTDVVTFRRHMPAGMTFREFGWMAAAVNFSDLASMGARPVGILPSFLMPPDMDETHLYEIVDGIEECASEFGAFILGGDTKTGEGAVSATALGSMDGRRPMTRAGARPGDVVAVTGTLGSAAAGYYALMHDEDERDAIMSLKIPVPRVDWGIALAEVGATACMDISDGLSTTVNGICSSSGVGMDILWGSLPVGTGVERMSRHVPKEHMMMDFGGEYELLFTFPKEKLHELYDHGIDLTVIGMVNDSGRACMLRDGRREEVGDRGYEHFKERGGILP